MSEKSSIEFTTEWLVEIMKNKVDIHDTTLKSWSAKERFKVDSYLSTIVSVALEWTDDASVGLPANVVLQVDPRSVQIECARRLMVIGAECAFKDRDGSMPLMKAQSLGQEQMVKMLEKTEARSRPSMVGVTH